MYNLDLQVTYNGVKLLNKYLAFLLRMSGTLFRVLHIPSCPVQKIITVTCMDIEWEMVLRRWRAVGTTVA
jgi:hypothetical protein